LQLQVTLIDRNDNAPRFDLSEYVLDSVFREDVPTDTVITTGMYVYIGGKFTPTLNWMD